MFTNRGRRLLGQAARNEVMTGGSVKKNDTIYEKVKTLFLDTAFSGGTFKGFFGRLSTNPKTGGILRLGLIWGDIISGKKSATELDATPVYDSDAKSLEAVMGPMRAELAQAKQESEAATKALGFAESAAKGQIKIQDGLQLNRVSVSYKEIKFLLSPSSTPFLQFGNGNKFIYPTNGNLQVRSAGGETLWMIGKTSIDARELEWDGKRGCGIAAFNATNAVMWASEPRDCSYGTLVFSSEMPFLEIFSGKGQRKVVSLPGEGLEMS